MSQSTTDRPCPNCGAAMPDEAPLGLCPSCLLATAAKPASYVTEQFTDGFTDAASGSPSSEPPRLADDSVFGSYRIARLLGRGGMGEVYEAVDADGRRVALKVLRQRLRGDDHRAQFLREGALAASVTDRHCVYVYGSDEIDGVPVIAMELAPQGTLKQQVDRFGPKVPSRVVEDVLQIVEGLKAAAASGILHRDVKPSNCFIAADGTIKIGDFGLSVSLNTMAGDVTWRPAFQGTPEYAAPEQLRGEPLDVRADIYGVGATLYFLLTGYSPFRERDMQRLIALKSAATLPSPADLRPDIPKALSQLVQACLSADPNRRPQSYDDLIARLRVFTIDMPAAGSLFMRFCAAVIDNLVLAIPLAVIALLFRVRPEGGVAWLFLSHLVTPLYFAILESRIGATPGKLLCGLRVVDVHGHRPGFLRAAARWAILNGPFELFSALLATGAIEQFGPAYAVITLGGGILQILSFFFARGRVDRAMFQDLWTGTRVVDAAAPAPAPASPPVLTQSLDVAPVDHPRLGPFDVLGRIGATPDGEILLGRDARLQRFVWIHQKRTDAPLTLARKELAQSSRLRWLLGNHTWDAFEAPDGRPFLTVCREPQSWERIRAWLVEMSRDLEAAEAAGLVPILALNRIWITADGRAMLLDFPAPGLANDNASASPVPRVPQFLGAMVDTALHGRRLPRAAAAALGELRHSLVVTAREAASIIGPLPYEQQTLHRWRRAIPIAFCAAPVALVMAASSFVVSDIAARAASPDSTLLLAVQEISARPTPGLDNDTAGALMQFVADSFRQELAATPAFWRTPRAFRFAAYRSVIERTMTRHPPVTPLLSERARLVTERHVAVQRDRNAKAISDIKRLGVIAGAAVAADSVLVPIAVSSLFLALFMSPLLLRFTGHAVVDATGNDAGLGRRLARAAATWWPLLLMGPIDRLAPSAAPENMFRTVLYCLPGTLIAAGAIYALVFPECAIQDRVAGTYVVPR